jgi:KDO2-lipid IV(A) lauroyltransferase
LDRVDIKGTLIVTTFRLLGLLPLPWVGKIGRLLGRIGWHVARSAREVTMINLGICFPEMTLQERKKLARESLGETFQTVLESGAAWTKPAAEVTRQITSVEGEHFIRQALDAKRGVVLIVPHLGNWEIANYYISSNFPLMAMYARSHMDGEFVPADKIGVQRLLKFLSNGGLTGILPDQQPSRKSGVFAPFFGMQALTPMLVSRLIQKTGAVALGLACLRNPDNRTFRMVCIESDPAIMDPDMEKSAAAMNRTIENLILLAPEQYQWEYKRFNKRPTREEPRPY